VSLLTTRAYIVRNPQFLSNFYLGSFGRQPCQVAKYACLPRSLARVDRDSAPQIVFPLQTVRHSATAPIYLPSSVYGMPMLAVNSVDAGEASARGGGKCESVERYCFGNLVSPTTALTMQFNL
jgi:hypothetical protein